MWDGDGDGDGDGDDDDDGVRDGDRRWRCGNGGGMDMRKEIGMRRLWSLRLGFCV